jgi:MoxR-like ATPase
MNPTTSNHPSEESFAHAGTTLNRAVEEMSRRIVGQRDLQKKMLLALMADGHILLEGLPGLAKTTAIKTLGEVTRLEFRRIQFTPDLLPSDVVGTQIFDPRSGNFSVKRGPVFANLILADEINRAPAKVQSALLEAMQERQVTLAGETQALVAPFLVMATQNPIEQEGTYALPEAQLDRFLFKIVVGYGTLEDEMEIMARAVSEEQHRPEAVLSASDILELQGLVRKVHVSEKIRRYIANVVIATRDPVAAKIPDLKALIEVGASPRASISLEKAARAQAILEGRSYVTPQDVKDVGLDVLRHRIIRSYEAEADNVTADSIVQRVFAHVQVP